MSGFRSPEVPREQLVLWAERLEEAIPPDHPVRLVDYLLRSEAFRETFREWEREYALLEGKPPYHPRDLTALYLYGMLNRMRSSRQLEAACYNRWDVIRLMSGQHPDHSTIAAFVSKHAKELRSVFKDVLRVSMQAGLVKLEHVVVDGTKIEADAGPGSVHSKESIESQLAKLEGEWEANEQKEGSLFGEEVAWAPKGADSPKRRLWKMKRVQERLKKALGNICRRREENPHGKEPKAIASVTDPDSRAMRDKEGRSKPNYNVQLAVDGACGMIVTTQVNDQPEDSGQLTPMLEEVEQICGRLPQEAGADSNYNTGPEPAALEEMGVTGYLPDNGENSGPPGKESRERNAAVEAARSGQPLNDEQWEALPKDGEGRIEKAAFTYDARKDEYRCPMGQSLPAVRTSRDYKKSGVVVRRQYGGCAACAGCPQAGMCRRDPQKGRMVNRDQYEEHRERLRVRMDTDVGRQRYKRRRETVEPRFGLIKHGMGIRRFLRRGLQAVEAECLLICTVVNLGILLRHWEQLRSVL